MMWRAKLLTPDEAHEVGIIDELVPEDSSETVLDRALSIAGDIIQRPPLAVAHIKRLARQSQQPVTADMLKMESRLFAELMQTEEAKALLAEVASAHRRERS